VLGKKILAGLFAALILAKLIFILISPGRWLDLVGAFLVHYAVVWWVYLVLIVITGCYIFSRLDVLDIALVMFFTSLLIGVAIIPYSAAWLKLGGEIAGAGLGQAWPAMLIWGALAVAVLYRVISSKYKR
jgi:hypothetical protein